MYKKVEIVIQRAAQKKNNRKSLQLDMLTIVGNLTLPKFMEDMLKKGPSCAVKTVKNYEDLIPSPFERLIKDLEIDGD